MRNEMGNNNVSGLQEEKSGIEEIPQKSLQETVPAGVVQRENHINPEDEHTEDFHGKVGEFSLDDLSGSENFRIDKQALDEEEVSPVPEGQDFHELATPSAAGAGEDHLENQTLDQYDSNDEDSHGCEVQTVSSQKADSIYEQADLERNLVGAAENHSHKQVLPSEKEESVASNSPFDSKSESHEVDFKPDKHEVVHAERVAESSSISTGENGHFIENGIRENNELDVVSEMADQNITKEMEELLAKVKASEEDNLLERTSEGKCEDFSPEEVEESSLLEASDLPLEAIQQSSSPQDKRIVLTEETELLEEGMEYGENDVETEVSNTSQLDPSLYMDSKKNEMESGLHSNSSVGVEEGCEAEKPKVHSTEPQVGFADLNLKLDLEGQQFLEKSIFLTKESKFIVCESEIGKISSAPNHTEFYKQEVLKDLKTDELASPSELMTIGPDSRIGEKESVLGFSSSSVTRESYQVEKPEVKSSDNFSSNSVPEMGNDQNGQKNIVMIAETESQVSLDEQSAKPQENVERLSTESNSGFNVELRKSPSFDIHLSVVVRPEECDQTLVVSHDKTAATGISSQGDSKLQKENVKTEASPPQEEVMFVEEKTIRMERSDSEKPTAPFLILSKEDQKHEHIVADKNEVDEDSWSLQGKEVLTSPQGSVGKRKTRSSLFTTCMCCATAIP